VVEAGGIEPPSRSGRRSRPTRVVHGLLSTSEAPMDGLRGGPAGDFSLPAVRRRTGSQPTNDGPIHPVGEGGDRVALVVQTRQRERGCCWQLQFPGRFYERPEMLGAPRFEAYARSNPFAPTECGTHQSHEAKSREREQEGEARPLRAADRRFGCQRARADERRMVPRGGARRFGTQRRTAGAPRPPVEWGRRNLRGPPWPEFLSRWP